MRVSDLRIDVVRRELPAMALQDGHHPARTVEQGVLRVFTDEGMEGNCLIGAWIPAESHFRPILDVIKPELVGREPFERECLRSAKRQDISSGRLAAWPAVEPASHYQPIADADLAQGVKRKGG